MKIRRRVSSQPCLRISEHPPSAFESLKTGSMGPQVWLPVVGNYRTLLIGPDFNYWRLPVSAVTE